MKRIILIPFICLLTGIILGIIYGFYTSIELEAQLTKLFFLPLVSHNLKVGGIIFIGGILTFSLLSLSLLLLNGFSLGIAIAALVHDYNAFFLIKYLFIHGLFELLGFVFIAIGSLFITYYCSSLIKEKYYQNKKLITNKKTYIRSSIIWTCSGTFLVILAALIEVIIV